MRSSSGPPGRLTQRNDLRHDDGMESSASLNTPRFRPPAEADSLILQIDQGCPHNRCTFCGMYRDLPYRRRDRGAIRDLIQAEARMNPEARRVFLADGDVMNRPFTDLRDVLLLLNAGFPRLSRVGMYANGRSILQHSETQLRTLRSLKLHTLYMGLESGDDDILRNCRKRETAHVMVEAVLAAQSAGLRGSVMVLIGLGGVECRAGHVRHTAEALNRMQPRLLSALRLIPVPGTELHADQLAGRFSPLSEWQAVRELRDLLARLELNGTVFRANHASNLVPLEGRLPHDRERLLAQLDHPLRTGRLDTASPGPMPLWL